MSDGTLQILDVTMLEDVGTGAGQLIQLDSNAKIPACSGAALTGLSSVTKNASDPAIATNPSGGVGTVWQNTTSGEMYICTDATAGANVWTNVGAGSGNVQPWYYQGEIAGYIAGGYNWNAAARLASIDKVSFTSDGAATDAGDLATGNPGRDAGTCTSSTTHLYHSGGYGPGAYTANTADVIERISFSAGGTATDVGNLVLHMKMQASSSNADYGWVHGGSRADPSPAGTYNVIWRYSHVASNNATDVGDLLAVNDAPAGHSDPPNSYGYCSSGSGTNVIQRYAMSSSGNSVDVGDLTITAYGRCGSSSSTHGYCTGNSYGQSTKRIDKFAYGSSSNATDVGDMLQNYNASTGSSSTTHGYILGGGWSGGPNGQAGSTNMDKYSYTTDGNSADVGDLTTHRQTAGHTGAQY